MSDVALSPREAAVAGAPLHVALGWTLAALAALFVGLGAVILTGSLLTVPGMLWLSTLDRLGWFDAE